MKINGYFLSSNFENPQANSVDSIAVLTNKNQLIAMLLTPLYQVTNII